MNAPLYNTEILRLAASIPFHDRIAQPMASVEKRSPVCGSRVTVDVDLDGDGRVARTGMLVRACALGQASAALMAVHVVGRVPGWPGLAIFEPALPHRARHPSIRLAFEAVAEAATLAARSAAA
jgi:hypothetical protein